MGRWFARFLVADGKEVVIFGRDRQKLLEAQRQLEVEVATDLPSAVSNADVVLISVPIDNFEEVVKQLQPELQPAQVVVDVTSVKVFPVAMMHRYLKKGLALGIHPVFGPGAKSIMNQNFVLTPTTEEETALAQKVKQYLEARGARAALMSPREHDELMAVILGLSHFIAMVSADTLLSFDKLKQMEAIGGSTYKVLLMMAKSVIAEDAEFYASLQMCLPRVTDAEKLFQKNARIWADMVKNKDRQGFVRRMNALKNQLEQTDPDFKKAYEDMYKLLEK